MTCVICTGPICGYGHNAEPAQKGLCCDECNSLVVIPMRMGIMFGYKTGDEEE